MSDADREELETLLTDRDALRAEVERLRVAVSKINAIRNDIVGRQSVHFSQHIYPLVAALEEAGIHGAGYEKARAAVLQFDRLLRAAQSLHRAWRRERAEVERLRESVHTACGSCGTPTNPDILVCPQCHDGWIVGNGAEFLDRATETLRAEVERLRRESVPMCVPTAEGFRRVGGRRLLAAALALHRAWRRERDLLPAEMPGCKIRFVECEHGHGRLTADNWVDHGCPWCTVDLARSTVARLRAFVSALRADGLDIDDPAASPTWTGKIHANGRLVFDLATVDEPAPPSESAPPICTWCGLPVETGKGMRVTRTDAAGVAHTFHWSCWSMHGEWVDSLPGRTP